MPARPRVLLLPGWLNSGADHWQTHWEILHGHERVEQSDWKTPLRGDWMIRLEETLLADSRPAVLVAHSLGCHLVAAWAAHTRHPGRVRAALLVAPPELDSPVVLGPLHSWPPVLRRRLPFAATLVYSDDDPWAAAAWSRTLAEDWGASAHSIGAVGHINGASGLGAWREGLVLLAKLIEAT
ncbi:MAG: serine hydrolase family protein [Burkholderiales bacterium]|nr:alpha/beta hydrolase [Burkholderiales bacterium]MDE1926307.1 serine hydrolase family protein [Burkholderiales bacterium]MDE2160064.1 serine hydrolase family protein [Burkholderiales bacterium]MDE2501475.1 serine hydrolase family protein [Burkholderiales bacterium]